MNHLHLGRSRTLAFLLATILAIGALTAWLVAFGIATFVYDMMVSNTGYVPSLVFTIEGQPLWQSYSPQDAVRGSSYTYRTLDGRTIEDPDSLHLTEARNQIELPAGPYDDFRNSYWLWRIRGLLESRFRPVAWYLVHDGRDDGSAWFVGYQPQSKQLIGYLGKKGFRAEMPPADEQFAMPMSQFISGGFAPNLNVAQSEPNSRFEAPALYVISDGSLFRVDTARQSVEQMSFPDKVVSVSTYDALTAVPDERHATYKEHLLVRLPKELHVLTLEGEPVRVIPLTDAMRDKRLLLMGTTGDESILIARGKNYYDPRVLYWIDSAGTVKRSETMAIDNRTPRGNGPAWGMTAALPAPGLLGGLVILGIALEERNEETPTASAKAAKFLAEIWLPYLLLVLVSAAIAVAVYRRQRALVGRAALAWAIFVLLLGLPGFVGYWTHRRWPARASCEHCGATVPRDRDTCLACAAEFPPPPLKGIEVFA